MICHLISFSVYSHLMVNIKIQFIKLYLTPIYLFLIYLQFVEWWFECIRLYRYQSLNLWDIISFNYFNRPWQMKHLYQWLSLIHVYMYVESTVTAHTSWINHWPIMLNYALCYKWYPCNIVHCMLFFMMCIVSNIMSLSAIFVLTLYIISTQGMLNISISSCLQYVKSTLDVICNDEMLLFPSHVMTLQAAGM